ncbi:MAG: hypothetical protein REH79_01235 [Spiroplasma sp.]|nr:hypothetical protein [Spiroplasma sp.]
MNKLGVSILTICLSAMTINQIININSNKQSNTTSNLNQNNHITKLNHEHQTRTEILNDTIKNNLINSITLINNQIIINYQNLNRELYSKEIYQWILNPNYLEALKIQYQLNLISFNEKKHIVFNDQVNLAPTTKEVWTEARWYWFGWWKLCLSHTAVAKILKIIGGVPGSTVAVKSIGKYLAKWITTPTLFAFASIIVINYFVLLSYSNNIKGCWIGILWWTPGFGWGSN